MGSEMCIRDSVEVERKGGIGHSTCDHQNEIDRDLQLSSTTENTSRYGRCEGQGGGVGQSQGAVACKGVVDGQQVMIFK